MECSAATTLKPTLWTPAGRGFVFRVPTLPKRETEPGARPCAAQPHQARCRLGSTQRFALQRWRGDTIWRRNLFAFAARAVYFPRLRAQEQITVETTSHPDVIVVTGASSGIGRAVAIAAGSRGKRVALLSRNTGALEIAADQIARAGGEALVLPVDVTDETAIDDAAIAVVHRWGRIDIWINCAMATVFAPVSDITPAEFRRVTDVTYLGSVYGTLAALRQMRRQQEGVIVQVGSTLAYRSIPLQSAYCAAKAALRGFTDSLRTELIHDHSPIRITMVQLPAVNTPQSIRQRNKMPQQAQPVPPMYAPEAIADLILWAAEKTPREPLIGWPSVAALWGQKFIPGLLDRYLGARGFASQFVDEPNSQNGRDILFETLPGDPGMHGPYRDREHGPDLQMRLRPHFRAVGFGFGIASLAFWQARKSVNGATEHSASPGGS